MTADKVCPTCGSDRPEFIYDKPAVFDDVPCDNSAFHGAKGAAIEAIRTAPSTGCDGIVPPAPPDFRGKPCATCGWPGVSPHIEPCGSHVFQRPAPPDSRGERCKHMVFLSHRCRDCENEPIDPKAFADFRMTLSDSRGDVEAYIRNLSYGPETSDYTKTLVAGNIREFWRTFCVPKNICREPDCDGITEYCSAHTYPTDNSRGGVEGVLPEEVDDTLNDLMTAVIEFGPDCTEQVEAEVKHEAAIHKALTDAARQAREEVAGEIQEAIADYYKRTGTMSASFVSINRVIQERLALRRAIVEGK